MLLRLWLAPLVLAFALSPLAPLSANEGSEITTDQRQAIESIVRDYLLQHPDVLIEALRAADENLKGEAKEKATGELKKRWDEVVNDPGSPVVGNPKGDVTIVEFFDYRCPYCKEVAPSMQELVKEDHELRIVYKEFPVLGRVSVIASRAALAARRQDKYEAFHIGMFGMKGEVTEDTVYTVAKSVGLDVDRLKRDMAAPEIDQVLKANKALANALDIRGTPAFVVGSQIIPGAIDLSGLKELVADARKR